MYGLSSKLTRLPIDETLVATPTVAFQFTPPLSLRATKTPLFCWKSGPAPMPRWE